MYCTVLIEKRDNDSHHIWYFTVADFLFCLQIIFNFSLLSKVYSRLKIINNVESSLYNIKIQKGINEFEKLIYWLCLITIFWVTKIIIKLIINFSNLNIFSDFVKHVVVKFGLWCNIWVLSNGFLIYYTWIRKQKMDKQYLKFIQPKYMDLFEEIETTLSNPNSNLQTSDPNLHTFLLNCFEFICFDNSINLCELWKKCKVFTHGSYGSHITTF